MESEEETVGRRRCAWCQKDLGPAGELSAGQVTDGICPECLIKFKADFEGESDTTEDENENPVGR